MPHYPVVAAIIYHKGKILCVQKGESKYPYISYKYEFPGGKIEAGEDAPEALVREIREELGILITVGESFLIIGHQYPDFSITLQAYLCEVADIEPLSLTEHIASRWMEPGHLTALSWAAADVPIVAKLTGTIPGF